MKTRTLLLLAVACGLVILVAGSIKLFLVADGSQPAHLAVGEGATIGDMTVTVLAAQQRDGMMLVDVTLVGVDDPDGATSWVFGTGDAQLRPVAPPDYKGGACGATRAATPTTCTLAFATNDTRGVLRYERANETRRWDITGP